MTAQTPSAGGVGQPGQVLLRLCRAWYDSSETTPEPMGQGWLKGDQYQNRARTPIPALVERELEFWPDIPDASCARDARSSLAPPGSDVSSSLNSTNCRTSQVALALDKWSLRWDNLQAPRRTTFRRKIDHE